MTPRNRQPRRPCSNRPRDERGNSAVQSVIVIPAVIMIAGLGWAGARIWKAESVVTSSAGAAARAASLDRTAGEARTDGLDVARSNLASRSLDCASTSVTIDTSAFATPVGTPGRITTQVSCTVTFSDLLLPGMPGSRTITGTGMAPLDSFRGRR